MPDPSPTIPALEASASGALTSSRLFPSHNRCIPSRRNHAFRGGEFCALCGFVKPPGKLRAAPRLAYESSSRRSDPYVNGFEAFASPSAKNPFTKGTEPHALWASGYEHAANEALAAIDHSKNTKK